MTTRARLTIATSLAAFAALAATGGLGAGVSAAQSGQWCEPQGQYKINISFGPVSCADAYYVAEVYNLTGEKYQDLYEYTCYSANSQLEPLIFQCVSNDSEFGVYWA